MKRIFASSFASAKVRAVCNGQRRNADWFGNTITTFSLNNGYILSFICRHNDGQKPDLTNFAAKYNPTCQRIVDLLARPGKRSSAILVLHRHRPSRLLRKMESDIFESPHARIVQCSISVIVCAVHWTPHFNVRSCDFGYVSCQRRVTICSCSCQLSRGSPID